MLGISWISNLHRAVSFSVLQRHCSTPIVAHHKHRGQRWISVFRNFLVLWTSYTCSTVNNSLMPGHDVIFSQPELQSKYICPECNLLLHEAVQLSCGHWLCQSCADTIISRERYVLQSIRALHIYLLSPSHSEPCCPKENCGELLTPEDDDTKLVSKKMLVSL